MECNYSKITYFTTTKSKTYIVIPGSCKNSDLTTQLTVVKKRLKGAGGYLTMGWSKFTFLVFLTEGHHTYQELFTE